MGHPKLGASWEGFAIEQFILRKGLKDEEVFFWSVHSSAEIDLIYFENGRMNGVEVKYTDSPKITVSMKTAMKDLDLKRIDILYPGKKAFKLDSKIFHFAIYGAMIFIAIGFSVIAILPLIDEGLLLVNYAAATILCVLLVILIFWALWVGDGEPAE